MHSQILGCDPLADCKSIFGHRPAETRKLQGTTPYDQWWRLCASATQKQLLHCMPWCRAMSWLQCAITHKKLGYDPPVSHKPQFGKLWIRNIYIIHKIIYYSKGIYYTFPTTVVENLVADIYYTFIIQSPTQKVNSRWLYCIITTSRWFSQVTSQQL